MLPQIFVSFIMFSLYIYTSIYSYIYMYIYIYIFHLGFYQTEEFMYPAGKQLCHPH